VQAIEVYDLRGALVARHVPTGERQWRLQLPRAAGTYLVVFRTPDGPFTERVVAF
jgi:hypothetical protein